MSYTLSESTRIGAVVLAAGKGTRMHSQTPKVLQRILDEPLLRYVLEAAEKICRQRIRIVIGHGADDVSRAFPQYSENFVIQEQQLGTGHALQTAWPFVLAKSLEYVVVINGDTPLIPDRALQDFVVETMERDADLGFISLVLDNPGAYGRVIREGGRVTGIVEAKDYDVAVFGPESGEINAGIYCLKASAITNLLPLLRNDNLSGELYITDLVQLAVRQGRIVLGYRVKDSFSLLGVNTPEELIHSEELLREKILRAHLERGVIVRSQGLVRIGPDVTIAPGVDITGPCEIYGKVNIGHGTRIASHCVLRAMQIAQGVEIRSFCHLESAHVATGCIIGPYARLRPGAYLDADVRVGNFVEIKNAHLKEGAKANHLSYIGDAEVGVEANIGAGTITCNYDGKNKHQTIIGDHAFIGSNTALVAPVSIGDGSLIGAGSVITKDVSPYHLSLTRSPQRAMPRRKP